MTDSFDGSVSITPTDTETITIKLDGDTAGIAAGGHYLDGNVLLRDRNGTVRACLTAAGNELRLFNATGAPVGIVGGAGDVRAGANGSDGDVFLYRAAATDPGKDEWSVRLSAADGRLEIRNAAGELICMIGADANLRLGANGADGDVLLYPASADDLFDNGAATVRIDANAADMNIGDNGTSGDIFLRDGTGQVRARLHAGSQRLELLNREAGIIAMIGGAGNVRAGSNGEDGDLYLYPRAAGDIFDNGAATVRIGAATGDMNLGDNGVDGDIFLRDGTGQVRARLRAASQRLELLDDEGRIIAMIGGAGNIRAGTNGEDGDLFLYRRGAGDIFDNGQATVRLSAATGDLDLGDNGTNGDVTLRDESGQVRARLQAGSQRLELLQASGQIIAMIGGDANVRVGGNGRSGNMFLYPQSATNIFDNSQASIELNGESGDILLRNADCAEEFPVTPGSDLVAGQVVCLADDAHVQLTSSAYDRRVVGVVAGAGGLKPGLVLGCSGPGTAAVRVALMGRVSCMADATEAPIDVGDPLVSSTTPGRAMKATDPALAFGAVIGKAIDPLPAGTGLIRVLVSLR